MDIGYALLIAIPSGFLGGLGHIMIYNGGRFTFPRTFIDENGDKHLLFESVKDLFLGALAGTLSILPVYSVVPGPYIGYLALLAGAGGSSVITGLIDKHISSKKQQVALDVAQYDVVTASLDGQQHATGTDQN